MTSKSVRPARYHVQVLDRAVHVLDLLASSGVEFGPSEISARLNLHKSTVHRILSVLEEHRLVVRNQGHGRYTLGTKMLELASRVIVHTELRTNAQSFLQQLVDETQETAHVAIIDGSEIVSIANVESPWTLRLRSAVGRRAPLYCTAVGKCLMAFRPRREALGLLKGQVLKQFTRRTFVTREALMRELRRVRKQGFAVDDEEYERGVRCVSAPVRDHTGGVYAAVSISGPALRLTRDRLPSLAHTVIAAARGMSVTMGYVQRPANG